MPRYDFDCNDCNNSFFVILGINETKEKIPCEFCSSKNTSRIYNASVLKNKTNESDTKEKVLPPLKPIHLCNHEHIHTHECAPEMDYL